MDNHDWSKWNYCPFCGKKIEGTKKAIDKISKALKEYKKGK
jgi:hypothetical protein